MAPPQRGLGFSSAWCLGTGAHRGPHIQSRGVRWGHAVSPGPPSLSPQPDCSLTCPRGSRDLPALSFQQTLSSAWISQLSCTRGLPLSVLAPQLLLLESGCPEKLAPLDSDLINLHPLRASSRTVCFPRRGAARLFALQGQAWSRSSVLCKRAFKQTFLTVAFP